MALLQQHDDRRDIVIEPAVRRRAAIEARGAFRTAGIRNWGRSELGAQSGRNLHGYRKRKQVVLQTTNYWICVIAVQQVSVVNICDAWNAPCRGVHGPYTPCTRHGL